MTIGVAQIASAEESKGIVTGVEKVGDAIVYRRGGVLDENVVDDAFLLSQRSSR